MLNGMRGAEYFNQRVLLLLWKVCFQFSNVVSDKWKIYWNGVRNDDEHLQHDVTKFTRDHE